MKETKVTMENRPSSATDFLGDSFVYPKSVYGPWWEFFGVIDKYFVSNEIEHDSTWEVLGGLAPREPLLSSLGVFKTITIVSGGLNPENGIFADQVIVESLLGSVRSGSKVVVVFGIPVVVDRNSKRNLFVDAVLHECGTDKLPENLQLSYWRKDTAGSRRPPLHFCAVDDKAIAVEYPHNEWQPVRRRIRASAHGSQSFEPLVAGMLSNYAQHCTALTGGSDLRTLYLQERTTIADELSKFAAGLPFVAQQE